MMWDKEDAAIGILENVTITTDNKEVTWVDLRPPLPCPPGEHSFERVTLVARWGLTSVKCSKCDNFQNGGEGLEDCVVGQRPDGTLTDPSSFKDPN